MVRIEKAYVFEGPNGEVSLADLFEGRPQLVMYHFDFGVSSEKGEIFGLSVFLRDGDEVFRTYFTDRRGVEHLGSAFTYLDLVPYGRQETWEDSPDGWPQGPPYEWWRRHDEYGPEPE